MKIFHTADWHLGKLFYGSYLTEDQAYLWKEQMLPAIKEYKPDVLIAAGDIYDRSLPPAEAVELLDEIITCVAEGLKIPMILISGNHDSAERLAFGSRLLAQRGVYVFGPIQQELAPIVIEDEHGPVSFVPIPYAEPAAIRHALENGEIRDHQQAMEAIVSHQLRNITAGHRKVAIAHAFVTGGIASDSERPLSIGGTDLIDGSVFSPFHYTALGHLHGPQTVGSETVRYSGSLLKYSFGEHRQKKGLEYIELGADGTIKREQIPLTPKRDVRIVEGTFEELMGNGAPPSEDYLLARLTDDAPVLDGMARLRKKYPYIRALEMTGRDMQAKTAKRADIRKVTEEEMFGTFVQETRGKALSEEEQVYMNRLWQGIWRQEEEV